MNKEKKNKLLNCWEFMKCGREPMGSKADELGVCQAAADKSFTGKNHGKCAGRICWAVTGTFCGGKVQGAFADKLENCVKCEFYQKVQNEESGRDARLSNLILKSLDQQKSANVTYRDIKSGERFITQGDTSDEVFLIQSGSCMPVLEKDQTMYPLDHIGAGELIGILGVFLNHERSTHVIAETDLRLMVIPKSTFDDISKNDPDMLDMLTELITEILDTHRPIAEKNIGKYTATAIIGRGGYSVVYKGIHRDLNMPVAIKMMRHNFAMNPDFLESFWNEAKTIASFNHNNIVKVYDIEKQYRTVFIIMEYLEGESLESVLKRFKVLPEKLAVNYIMQVLSAFDYAHSFGVIHRDINTVNIFVHQNGTVKVIDFGLACSVGDDFMEEGTIHYAAPEQLEYEDIDQRADIFSLGITAYEIITGQKPFMDENLFTVRTMLVENDIPDPTKLNPDISEVFRDFILKATRRDPNERYQNAKEAMEALSPLATSLNISQNKTEHTRKTTSLHISYADTQELEVNACLKNLFPN